jgi:hypothetical protein
MYMSRSTCVPSRDDRLEGGQAVRIRYLVATQPGFAAGILHIFSRVNTGSIAVPDIYLDVRHGSATVLAVERIDTQGQRNSALGVGSVEIRTNVTARESGGAAVHVGEQSIAGRSLWGTRVVSALAGALDSGVGGPDPVGGGLSGLLAPGTDHKPGTLRGGLYTDGQCRIVAGAA